MLPCSLCPIMFPIVPSLTCSTQTGFGQKHRCKIKFILSGSTLCQPRRRPKKSLVDLMTLPPYLRTLRTITSELFSSFDSHHYKASEDKWHNIGGKEHGLQASGGSSGPSNILTLWGGGSVYVNVFKEEEVNVFYSSRSINVMMKTVSVYLRKDLIPRVCPSSDTLECHSCWTPRSVSGRKRSVQGPVTVSAWLLSVRSYLAVEHLISCHVVQLNPVQIISAKHTFHLFFPTAVHLCGFPHEWTCSILVRQRGNISLVLYTVSDRSLTTPRKVLFQVLQCVHGSAIGQSLCGIHASISMPGHY